jgi:hypothetical protein
VASFDPPTGETRRDGVFEFEQALPVFERACSRHRFSSEPVLDDRVDFHEPTHSSVAQQIAQAASAFEHRRTGRPPQSVTVVLSEDTLVISTGL